MKSLQIDKKQLKVVLPIKQLLNTNILSPEIQRIIDNERVDKIVSFQLDYYFKNGTFLFMGDITLATIKLKDTLNKDSVYQDFYNIDGLHRMSAIKKLALLEKEIPIMDYGICVNIIEVSSIEEIEKLFRLINMAQPIPEYILDVTFDKSKKQMLKDFEYLFISRYKHYISDAFKPQRPNVNMKKIMDKIYESNLLEIFKNGYELFTYFIYINDYKLKDLDPDNVERCEKKKTTNFLYITSDPKHIWMRDRTWINEYISIPKPVKEVPQSHIFTNTFYITKNTSTNTSNCNWYEAAKKNKSHKSIPSAIRYSVWRNYHDSMDAYCPLCLITVISIDNFDCGHVISHKNGGSENIDNLIPLCSKCNKSMGAVNLTDYCLTHGIQDPCNESMDHDSNR